MMPVRTWVGAGLFAIVFGALALFSMSLRPDYSASVLVWPAGGILLGAMMRTPPARWPLWLAIATILHLAVSLYGGRSAALTAVYTLQQLFMMPLVAAIWRTRVQPTYTLDTPHSVAWFVGLLAVVTLACGLLTHLVVSAIGLVLAPTPLGTWLGGAISDGIGGLIGAPLVVAWASVQARRSGGPTPRDFWAGLVWFALLAVAAVVVFDGPTARWVLGADGYELSYLPLLFVILVALQWGQRGLTLAIVLLAGVALLNTMQGEGPFASGQSVFGDAILEVQGYLGAAALLGLLMAAIASTRDRALKAAAAWKVRYEAALLGSQHLSYAYDPATRAILWGGDVAGLLGLAPEALASLDGFIERVHPDERDRVVAVARQRAQGSDEPPSESRFRFLCGDGQYRTLVDTGAALVGLDDEIYGVNGLLRLAAEAE